MPNDVERLETLRRTIDSLDGELIAVLAKRMSVVKEIGLLKKEAGLPVLQEHRYTELRINFINRACRAGLDGEFAEALIEAVHDSSVKIQRSILAGS